MLLVNKLRTVAIVLFLAMTIPWFMFLYEIGHFPTNAEEVASWLVPRTAPSFALSIAIVTNVFTRSAGRKERHLGRFAFTMCFVAPLVYGMMVGVVIRQEHVVALSIDLSPGASQGFALLNTKMVEIGLGVGQALSDGVVMAFLINAALATDDVDSGVTDQPHRDDVDR